MLSVEKLQKHYRKNVGITDISFSVDDGTILAVVGHNGAGKSTLFNILMGILNADDGTAKFDGVPLPKLPKKLTGFMPEQSYIMPYFSPRQMLLYVSQMKSLGLSDTDVESVAARFGMTNYLDAPNSSLSQGMAKRVSIALALMGDPKFVILDEPTNGLDTHGVLILKNELLRLKKSGAVILISSHILDFLNTFCDGVLFMKSGYVADICYGDSVDIERRYLAIAEIGK